MVPVALAAQLEAGAPEMSLEAGVRGLRLGWSLRQLQHPGVAGKVVEGAVYCRVGAQVAGSVLPFECSSCLTATLC
jgi:hypothetical protein